MDSLEYELRESARAKHLRVTIYPGGKVIVTKPRRTSAGRLSRFLSERREWILRMREKQKSRPRLKARPSARTPRLRRGSKEHCEAVAKARAIAHERLLRFHPYIYEDGSHPYGRVAIRSQKTRWGSCSRKGNLNFNYKIAFLPPELADYVIVHELCHLRHMNHSPKFWAEVGRILPNHKDLRKALRSFPL